MVKKKLKFKDIPPLYMGVGIVSLLLNAILLGTIFTGYALEETGSLDYATVNAGIERMCSDKFRQAIISDNEKRGASENEKGLRLALVDYPCSQNGAKQYYENGYKEYVRSLGLNP